MGKSHKNSTQPISVSVRLGLLWIWCPNVIQLQSQHQRTSSIVSLLLFSYFKGSSLFCCHFWNFCQSWTHQRALLLLTERSKRQSVSDSEGFGEGPCCLCNQIWGVITRKAQIVMNLSNLSIRLNNALWTFQEWQSGNGKCIVDVIVLIFKRCVSQPCVLNTSFYFAMENLFWRYTIHNEIFWDQEPSH